MGETPAVGFLNHPRIFGFLSDRMHTKNTPGVDAHVPQLVTAKALTLRFGLTAKGVRALPIPKVKIGRRATRYHLSDVLEFLQRRTVRVEGTGTKIKDSGSQ